MHADGALSIEQTEARDMLNHLTACPHDDHLTCSIKSTYLAERVDAGSAHLAGNGDLNLEAPIPAMSRVKTALANPGAVPGRADGR